MSYPNRFLIIDDHQLFSAGLRQILMTLSDREAIHCFDNPMLGLGTEFSTPVSLIILDFYIPGFDIPHCIGLFSEKYPHTPIVVISSSISPSDKQTCLAAGARAYLEKNLPPDIVLARIKEIVEGGPHRPVAESGISELLEQHGLTSRQMDILIQLARGNSNKKIAEKLHISPETVKSHLSSVYKQLGLSTRSEANDWARDHGMV